MKKATKDEVFYVDTAVTAAESIILAAGFSEAPDAAASRLYFKFGEIWGSHDIDSDFIVSIAYSAGQMFAVGRNGLVKTAGKKASAFTPENVRGKIRQFLITDAQDRGHLSAVRHLGQAFVTCGWGGQMYRLLDARWERFEEGIKPNRENTILDVGGVFPSDVYAVGLNGLLLHYDGRRWRYLDSPTNNHLYGVLYLSKTDIYLYGAHGGLYSGSGESWTFIGTDDEDSNFWSVARYCGDLYISHGDKGLFKYDESNFRTVRFGLGYSPYTNKLTVGDEKLWSTGSHDLLKFDGRRWEPVICPDNE